MKRNLITAAALYLLLFERQRRVERRLLSWKRTRDEEMHAWAAASAHEFEQFAEQNWKWSERLVKNINDALKGAR